MAEYDYSDKDYASGMEEKVQVSQSQEDFGGYPASSALPETGRVQGAFSVAAIGFHNAEEVLEQEELQPVHPDDEEKGVLFERSIANNPIYTTDILAHAQYAMPMYEVGGRRFNIFEARLIRSGRISGYNASQLRKIRDYAQGSFKLSDDRITAPVRERYNVKRDIGPLFRASAGDIQFPDHPVNYKPEFEESTATVYTSPTEVRDKTGRTRLVVSTEAKVEIPNFDRLVQHNWLWNPKFSVYPIDGLPFTIASNLAVLSILDGLGTTYPIDDMIDIANNNYLGTSGVPALIGRLKKAKPIREIARANTIRGYFHIGLRMLGYDPIGVVPKSLRDSDIYIIIAFHAYASLVNRTMHTKNPDTGCAFDCVPFIAPSTTWVASKFENTPEALVLWDQILSGKLKLNQKLSSTLGPVVEVMRSIPSAEPMRFVPYVKFPALISFKPSSNAGLLFDKTHREVQIDEVVAADLVLARYSGAYEAKDVIEMERICSLSKAVSKAEVYSAEKFDKVERIIYATNTFYYLPQTMILKAAMYAHKLGLSEGGHYSRVTSLAGFSVVDGAWPKIMTHLISNFEKDCYFVYADNIYVGKAFAVEDDLYPYRLSWASLDGSSMEASHTQASTAMEAIRFLMQHENLSFDKYEISRLLRDAASGLDAEKIAVAHEQARTNEQIAERKTIKKMLVNQDFKPVSRRTDTWDELPEKGQKGTRDMYMRKYQYSTEDTYERRLYKMEMLYKGANLVMNPNVIPSSDGRFTGGADKDDYSHYYETLDGYRTGPNYKEIKAQRKAEKAQRRADRLEGKEGEHPVVAGRLDKQLLDNIYTATLATFQQHLGDEPLMSAQWARYFFRSMLNTCESPALIGVTQFLSPGLQSGTGATFHMNHTRSCMLANAFIELDMEYKYPVDGISIDPEYKKVAESLGVVLKQEAGFINKEFDESYRWKDQFARTDLLGFDLCQLVIEGKQADEEVVMDIPILNYDRLLKSLVFGKPPKHEYGSEHAVLKGYLDLMKARTLYIIGGWAYEGLSVVLYQMAMVAAAFLYEKDVEGFRSDTVAAMMMILCPGQDPDDVPGIFRQVVDKAMSSSVVPTMDEVMELFTGTPVEEVMEEVLEAEDIIQQMSEDTPDVRKFKKEKASLFGLGYANFKVTHRPINPMDVPGFYYKKARPEPNLADGRMHMKAATTRLLMQWPFTDDRPVYFNPGEQFLDRVRRPDGELPMVSDLKPNDALSLVTRLVSVLTKQRRSEVASYLTDHKMVWEFLRRRANTIRLSWAPGQEPYHPFSIGYDNSEKVFLFSWR